MKRRDFLKLTAAASFSAAASACSGASAASSAPASEVLPGSTPTASNAAFSGVGLSLTTNEGDTISFTSLEHCTQEETAPAVYFTREISAEALVEVYQALGWAPTGNVAVKLSTGEPPASNYLRPDLVAGLVQLVNGTIVECNTAYGGSRSSTESHRQVAEEHGFAAIAQVDIQDAEGSMTLPVEGGARLQENYVGASFGAYQDYVVLSHFKGHSMAGYGAPSRIFPSGWPAGRASSGFIPAAPAAICGAGNRMPSWKPWQTQENPSRMPWTMGPGWCT